MSLCDDCQKPGVPYTYKDIRFDGLHADRGSRVCSPCLQARLDDEIAHRPEVGIAPIHGAYKFKRWCHVCNYHDCDPAKHRTRKA